MNKQMELIRMVFKCGKTGKSEKNSAVGDATSLIMPLAMIAAMVGMFFAGQYVATHAAMFGDAATVFTTILSVAGLLSFMITLMNAINQMYISSDLDVLVTLPFTPAQIVTAKLVSVSKFPVAVCFGLSVPAAIGYFCNTQGLSPLFIPAMVIGSLVLAVWVVSLAAILLMIVMRVFRFIRSRNFISIVTALLMFALLVVYMVISSNNSDIDESKIAGIFSTVSGMMSGVAYAMPSIGFTIKAASGEALYLLLTLGIAVIGLILLAVFAKAFYFQAALSMTDANGVRGPVSEKTMRKAVAKTSQSKTLARREIKQIFRTPALITNGYLLSIIFPLFVVGGTLFKLIDLLKEAVTVPEGLSYIEFLREGLRQMNIQYPYFLIGCTLCGMLMASLAVASSCLSRFLISREGQDFATLKAMPISAVKLVMIKRNAAMLMNGIAGFILPALLLIAAGIMGLIPLWISLLCAASTCACLVAFVDLCAVKDVQAPNLNWDNEADVTKNNVFGLILFGVVLALVILSVVLLTNQTGSDQTLLTIQGWVTALLPFPVAIFADWQLRNAAKGLY